MARNIPTTGGTLAHRLLSLPLFAGVEMTALAPLDLRLSARAVAPGEALIEQGDPSRDVFFLVSGRLLCVIWTEEGKEILFSRVAPGDYLGEMSAIDGRPRSLSVYAQLPSEVIVMSHESFHALLAAVPTISGRIIRNLVGLVRRLTDRSYQATARTVEQRVRAYLAHLAYQSGASAGSALNDPPSQTEIANSIGANREAVSRAMSSLRKTGIIASGRNRLHVLRPDALMLGLLD